MRLRSDDADSSKVIFSCPLALLWSTKIFEVNISNMFLTGKKSKAQKVNFISDYIQTVKIEEFLIPLRKYYTEVAEGQL